MEGSATSGLGHTHTVQLQTHGITGNKKIMTLGNNFFISCAVSAATAADYHSVCLPVSKLAAGKAKEKTTQSHNVVVAFASHTDLQLPNSSRLYLT